MKCPNCGKEGLKYEVSREKYWGKNVKSKEPRTNFKVKPCTRCGFAGEVK